jgi:hypothetical protein
MRSTLSLSLKGGLILLALGLALAPAAVRSADWKEFTEATTGIFYFDAGSVQSPSEGIVRVWIHNGTKQESSLLELNCRQNTYKVLDVTAYDQSLAIKSRGDYYDNPEWLPIPAKSIPEMLQTIVCP